MSQQSEHVPAASAAGEDSGQPRRRRSWTRTHLIWALSVLSLLPGLIAAAAPGVWSAVPSAARLVTYAVSGVAIVAAVALIMAAPGRQ
jgi:hypothetical protein